jgi:uncharacterized protein (TIGR02145 family)
MRNLKLISILLFTFFVFSCKKDKNNPVEANTLIKGRVDIPDNVAPSIVTVSDVVGEYSLDDNNEFSTTTFNPIIAYNSVLGDIIYIGIPSPEEKDNYNLNAKETAIFLTLRSIPLILQPQNYEIIGKFKDYVYSFQEVKNLEQKIIQSISTNAILNVDYFANELSLASNKIISEIGLNKPPHTNLRIGTTNGFVKGIKIEASDKPDVVDPITGEITIVRKIYNEHQAVLGVGVGDYDYNTEKVENWNGAIEGYLAPMNSGAFIDKFASLSGFPSAISSLVQDWKNVAQYGVFNAVANTTTFSTENEITLKVKNPNKDGIVIASPKLPEVAIRNIIELAFDGIGRMDGFATLLTETKITENEFIAAFYNWIVLPAQEQKFNSIRDDVANKNYNAALHTTFDALYDFFSDQAFDAFLESAIRNSIDNPQNVPQIKAAATKYYNSFSSLMKKVELVNIASNIAGFLTEMYFFESFAVPVNFSDNYAPASPIILAPLDKEILNNVSVTTLRWSSTDPEGDPISYDIYLGTNWSNIQPIEINIQQTSLLLNIQPNTRYVGKVVAKAGNQKSETNFTFDNGVATNTQLPTVTTTNATNITNTQATTGGNVTNQGSSAVTVKGVCWSTTQNPTITNNKTVNGSGTGSYSTDIYPLTANTTYYVRAYATNSSGTAYGNQLVFLTTANTQLPTVTTTNATNITNTQATTGGNVTDQGSSAVTVKGVCWSTTQNPTTANNKTVNGSGTGSYNTDIYPLTANTTYYVRAYATNGNGTAYGNQISLATTGSIFNPNLTYGTMTDIDGNVYKTIQIGTQTWMAENLKTTRYNDGIAIRSDISAWGMGIGAYTINNNTANNTTYGKLYNWYAVNTGKLAPAGWHVPTDAEWATLINYLGGGSVAGNKMKATTLWSPNTGATNSSGFTGLPAGGYYPDGWGNWYYSGIDGRFWSTSTHYTNVIDRGWMCLILHNTSDVMINSNEKYYGYSVRCVRD